MTDADLQRRLDKLEPAVEDIRTRVSALEKADAVANVHRINVETRLKSIEDTLKWLVRLVLGALILALIGFILGGGMNVPAP